MERGALVPVPKEPKAIKKMIELRRMGLSLRDIACQVEWNHQFHLPHEAVRRVLAAEVAKG